MIKFIIVDDEKIIRDGLSHFMEWEKFGFKLVGVATNGITAWSLIEETRPDLVISDIYMPLSSGIELAEKIKSYYPEMLIVFLSGYNDFVYAQSAIGLGVYRYLSKPVDSKELLSLLEDVKEEFTRRKQHSKQKEAVKKQIAENRSILQNNLIRKLILGRIDFEEALITEKLIGLDLTGTHYQLFVTALDELVEKSNPFYEMDPYFQLYLLLDNIKNRIIIPNGYIYFCQIGESEIIGLLIYKNEIPSNNEQIILNTLSNLQLTVRKSLSRTISIGLSEVSKDVKSLRELLHQSRRALDGKIHTGPSSIILFKDINEKNMLVLPLSGELRERFIQSIRKNNISEVKICITEFIETLNSGIDNQTIYILTAEVLSLFTNSLFEAAIPIESVFGEDYAPFKILYELKTLSEVKNWLEIISEKVIHQKEVQSGHYTKRTVEAAKVYIYENFHEKDLNLASISEAVFLSPCYFSQLFNKSTNMSLVDFIADVRLEKAKKLLKNTHLKAYEIADKVGYKDSHYFSSNFKKKIGISPTEFRQQVHFDI